MINLNEVLNQARRRKPKRPESNIIRAAGVTIEVIKPKQPKSKTSINGYLLPDKNPEAYQEEADHIPPTKAQLMSDVIRELKEVRVSRAKLSNQYHDMIEKGASQAELKEHYQKIEGYTGQLQKLWERRQFIERYGREPVEQKKDDNPYNLPSLDTNNLEEIQHLCRYVTVRRYKLSAKLKNKKLYPAASSKREAIRSEINELKEKHDQLKQRRKELKAANHI